MTEAYDFETIKDTFLTPTGSARYNRILNVIHRMLESSGAFTDTALRAEIRGAGSFTRAVLEQLCRVGFLQGVQLADDTGVPTERVFTKKPLPQR